MVPQIKQQQREKKNDIFFSFSTLFFVFGKIRNELKWSVIEYNIGWCFFFLCSVVVSNEGHST